MPGRDLTPILYRFVDDGKLVAYVYYESEPSGDRAAKPLTRDEARRIAVNIAKLPELLSRHKTWGVR